MVEDLSKILRFYIVKTCQPCRICTWRCVSWLYLGVQAWREIAIMASSQNCILFTSFYFVDEYKVMFWNALNARRQPYDIIVIQTTNFIHNIEFTYMNVLHITGIEIYATFSQKHCGSLIFWHLGYIVYFWYWQIFLFSSNILKKYTT
jgi:hypothetical protein